MFRMIFSSFIVIVCWTTAVSAADQESKPADRIVLWPDGRLPVLTTSRVVGSPDPPLPYTTERLYPNLKLSFPVAVVHQPESDRMWTITLDGPNGMTNIRRFVDDADVSETEIILPADDRVASDIVFHPGFLQNGFVYVGHNRPIKPEGEKYTRISRFKMNPLPPFEFDPKSETTIIEWPSDGHNGAAVAFGLDGMLYVTSGDGTSDSDTNLRGQEMTHLTAKVLRIDVDHPPEGKQYAVPSDNPFVGTANIAPETWAFGLRNPWRMTVDRETGHIWVGNNGQDLWEQIYFVRKGDNYGWSVFEGSHPFYEKRELGPAPHVKPMLEHHHSESRSLTGGIVFYGNRLTELRGAYIYGDHSTGKIWGAKHDGTNLVWHKELADTPFHITGFGTNSQGDLLICDYVGNGEGAFYTLVPSPPQSNPNSFPRTLSESGLFRSVKGHVVESALIPYTVNAPLWSDGAEKTRFMAIPGEGPKIEITNNRGWNFPNETVLVKSFSIELTEGKPESKRWIETRFLTKQQNEWIGYSYRWNDEQTDATLVAKEGLDRDFTIQTAEGPRQQTWHYPSRTECMVCHSRAAGFVLGLSTGQMNREFQDPLADLNRVPSIERKARRRQERPEGAIPRVENQLAMLERLGLFKLDKSVDQLERLVNPLRFANEKLERRAKSYLHANCAICHVEAGGGNSQMLLDFITPLDKMKLVDALPVHDKFGLSDARLIAPGHPERSVLLHRVATRGRGQMPQLATSIIDQSAVAMLTEWIRQMAPSEDDGRKFSNFQFSVVPQGRQNMEAQRLTQQLARAMRTASSPPYSTEEQGILRPLSNPCLRSQIEARTADGVCHTGHGRGLRQHLKLLLHHVAASRLDGHDEFAWWHIVGDRIADIHAKHLASADRHESLDQPIFAVFDFAFDNHVFVRRNQIALSNHFLALCKRGSSIRQQIADQKSSHIDGEEFVDVALRRDRGQHHSSQIGIDRDKLVTTFGTSFAEQIPLVLDLDAKDSHQRNCDGVPQSSGRLPLGMPSNSGSPFVQFQPNRFQNGETPRLTSHPCRRLPDVIVVNKREVGAVADHGKHQQAQCQCCHEMEQDSNRQHKVAPGAFPGAKNKCDFPHDRDIAHHDQQNGIQAEKFTQGLLEIQMRQHPVLKLIA